MSLCPELIRTENRQTFRRWTANEFRFDGKLLQFPKDIIQPRLD